MAVSKTKTYIHRGANNALKKQFASEFYQLALLKYLIKGAKSIIATCETFS